MGLGEISCFARGDWVVRHSSVESGQVDTIANYKAHLSQVVMTASLFSSRHIMSLLASGVGGPHDACRVRIALSFAFKFEEGG